MGIPPVLSGKTTSLGKICPQVWEKYVHKFGNFVDIR